MNMGTLASEKIIESPKVHTKNMSYRRERLPVYGVLRFGKPVNDDVRHEALLTHRLEGVHGPFQLLALLAGADQGAVCDQI